MLAIEQEYNKAVEKFRAGQYKPAEKILLKINKRQAGIPDVLHMLAHIAMETNRHRTAVKYISQAIKSIPNNAALLNLLGCAHYRQGNVESAIEVFAKAISVEPKRADIRFNLANALQDAHRSEEAVAEYQHLIQLRPDDADSLNGLGQALWEIGEHDSAFKAFTAALELDPGDAEIHVNMGAALTYIDRLEDASQHLSKALELEPNMPKAMLFLADVMHKMGSSDDAISVIKKALILTPGSKDLHRVLGVVYQDNGQIDEALASFKQARRLRPGDPETLSALSNLLEKSSKLKEASDVVTEGLKAAPDHYGLNLNAARVAYRSGEHEKALSILHSMKDDEQPFELRRERYFELGRAYDRLGEADEAYASFAMGNKTAADSWKARKFNKNQMIDYVDRHLDVVNGPWISKWSPQFDRSDGEQSPVFIIGFPRSGTTLVDQILDSHPSIQVLEEPPTVETVRAMLMKKDSQYPGIIANLSQEEIARLRRLYFETAYQTIERKGGSLLIDKMPLNTVDVALIHRLFPDAKFILSLRHPCDVCLSCFMQSFDLNVGMTNFLTLQDTAILYAGVMRLWQRYESLLPLNILRIRYEDLVEDLEDSARELLEFLGLPWDDAVLNYDRHAAKRSINTPSYSQVTQKIYTRARYRWLRYEKYLNPVICRLQPFINEFGYGEAK